MKKIILFYIVFINSLFAQQNSATLFNLSEYFPLNLKTKMIFNSTIGETIRTVQKADSFYVVSINTDKLKYNQTYCKKGNGIYLISTEQNVKILFFSKHAEVAYNEPALQLKQPLRIGDTWQWNGYQIKNGKDSVAVTMSGRVIANERIEVPAGKFETLKVEIIITDNDVMKTVLTQWLVKDVGAVKTQIETKGKGILHWALSLMGYSIIVFELEKIITLP